MPSTTLVGGVLAAALLLPGLAAPALAETAPEQGTVAFKWLSYRDWQPGLDRIKVSAPSVYVLAPLGSAWALEGSVVSDSVSGASPRYHSAISGASRLNEERQAGDLKLSHYGEREAWSVGTAFSTEHDYTSRTVSGDYRWSTEDNNRSWNIGAAYSSDTVGSSNDPSLSEPRRTWQFSAGVTQALSPVDLLQFNLGRSAGKGHYSDPYKFPDLRPDRRTQTTALLRWNHHVAPLNATLRSGLRYYRDSYGVSATTLDASWVQPVSETLSLTPLLRYTSQRAARFYVDPVYSATLGEPFPPGYQSGQVVSADQRLAGFGALTGGLRLDWTFAPKWTLDLSYQRYEQRGDWRIGGSGSPGLAPFSAAWWQLGLARNF
ncbi:DUF3570 domain-containing protein [Ideonella sp.]|uniref:DUF3570 domain-containing protein n=1 Tax=Ideonella sp. TaxID=1929293 RepID=UPI003BB7650F